MLKGNLKDADRNKVFLILVVTLLCYTIGLYMLHISTIYILTHGL